MSATITPDHTARLDLEPARSTHTSTGRGWAFTGVAAGLASIVGIAASMQIDAVYSPDADGDPDAIVAAADEAISPPGPWP